VAQPATLNAVTHHQQGGYAIADIVPEGTPGTIWMPFTGHVLALPMPGPVYGKGEMWAGYLNRVQLQCGAPPGDYNGRGMYSGDAYFADLGGFKQDGSNWPLGADRYFNAAAYASDEEKAAVKLLAEREAKHAPGSWAAMGDAYRNRGANSEPKERGDPKVPKHPHISPHTAATDVPISA
jgi:hypothetical protein